MKTITQRELAARSKIVLDDVEAGQVYHITRNGVEIAELRAGGHFGEDWRGTSPTGPNSASTPA